MSDVSVSLNDFRAQWEEIREDALAAVDRVGRSGWLVLGQEVAGFERDLAGGWGLGHAVGCGNGLDAIEIGLRATGLRPGERVLTTPLSAFATALAIVRAGGVPVFCDVDDCGLLDLEQADAVLAADPEIRFAVPVHLYGFPLDLGALEQLAQRHGVTLIEDCAQSIGARRGGRVTGSAGAAAATSFYPTKNLGAMGDGGALLTDDPELAAAARQLRDYGQSAKYVHASLGLNSRLDELQAAILRDALRPRLAAHGRRRGEIASAYHRGLDNPDVLVPDVPADSEPAWHLFPVVVRQDRQGLQDFLAARGVASARHYPTLQPDQPALRDVEVIVAGTLARARDLAEHEVSLPIHPYLDDPGVQRVVDAVNTWRPPA